MLKFSIHFLFSTYPQWTLRKFVRKVNPRNFFLFQQDLKVGKNFAEVDCPIRLYVDWEVWTLV